MGISTKIFQEAFSKLNTPVVVFIVEKPIFNKASIYWYEHNGFEFSAIFDGEYKGESFKFLIYVNWNGAI